MISTIYRIACGARVMVTWPVLLLSTLTASALHAQALTEFAAVQQSSRVPVGVAGSETPQGDARPSVPAPLTLAGSVQVRPENFTNGRGSLPVLPVVDGSFQYDAFSEQRHLVRFFAAARLQPTAGTGTPGQLAERTIASGAALQLSVSLQYDLQVVPGVLAFLGSTSGGLIYQQGVERTRQCATESVARMNGS